MKLKLGIIFGGQSTEHEVSIKSSKSVIHNLNQNKFDIFPIYIDKNGSWYKCNNIYKDNMIEKDNIDLIDNIINYLKELDLIFPVLHGKYGEDGTIQGMLDLFKIPYIGCGILSSSICMDKVYAKIIFNKIGIKQANYMCIKKCKDLYVYVNDDFSEDKYNLDDICKVISNELMFPLFIKPSKSGSSVGINKANNIEELKKYIEYAADYDNKVLIEEMIKGREIECAVYGNNEVCASCLGEVKAGDDFYSYDAKYNNSKSYTIIPAEVDKDLSDKVRSLAIKAYKAVDCRGLSRVDFFIEDGTNDIIINEINTMPGFTDISMYPKLWEASGISYSELLDKLIELGLED